MKKPRTLFGFFVLAVAVGVILLLSWPKRGELEPALSSHQHSQQSEIESPIIPEQDSSRSRGNLKSSSTLPTDSEDIGDCELKQPAILGWLVAGRVVTSNNDPIAAAKISLHHWGLPDTNVKSRSVTSTTDEDGNFQAFVPIPHATESHAPSRSFPGLIVGIADAAGYIPVRNDSEGGILSTNHPSTFMPLLPTALPLERANQVRVDFVMKAGAVACGRVITATGAPVQQARINIKTRGSEWSFGGVTGEDGHYWVPVDLVGEHMVSAEKEGVGIAGAVTFTADEDRSTDLPDMVLKGSESLSGIVVFPDGSPIRGVEISVSLKRQSKSKNADISLDGLLGCTKGLTITDERGLFNIDGLHPGSYEVETQIQNDFLSTEETDVSQYEQVHDTGTSNIRFILPVHLLRASLHDLNGRSLPGQFVFQPNFTSGDLSESNAYVHETTSGAASIQIVPGDWTVWGFSNGWEPVKQTLTISGKTYETTLELNLPKVDRSGNVRLSVKGSDNRPIGRIGVSIFKSKPCYTESGFSENIFPLIRESLSSETGQYEFPAPTGSFYMSVWARGFSKFNGLPFPGAAYHGASVDNVEVGAGKRTDLSVKLEQGGLVRLTLHFDRTGTNFFIANVKVHDVTQDGAVMHLPLAEPGSTSRTRSTELDSDKPYLGLKLLKPGLYRLEVKARGYPKRFKKTEVVFSVQPGKVTNVEAWIEEE